MPRTPAVYEPTGKWRIKYEEPYTQAEEWAPNYKTVRERLDVIQQKVQEDVVAGRMKKTTYAEAKKTHGDALLIGALGLVDEGQDQFRLIHDGTHRT